MLELSDDEEQPGTPPPAPTTAAVPAGRKKQTRRKGPDAAEDAAEHEGPIALGKRRQRAWEENSGACGHKCMLYYRLLNSLV